MPKYIIPTPDLPCATTRPHSRKKTIWLILISIIFSTSIILYIVLDLRGLYVFGNHNTTPTSTYYLVYTTPTDTDSQGIHEQSKNIKMRGGAGNIIKIADNTIIALYAYLDKQKALSVTDNLATQGITASVVPLHTLTFDLDGTPPIQRDNILSNITFVEQLLHSTFDIITQFDTMNITQNKLYTNIYRLKLSCDLELSSLTTLPNFETHPVYLQMLDITSILGSLCNRDFNGYNLTTISCEFKYSLVAILLCICSTPVLPTTN